MRTNGRRILRKIVYTLCFLMFCVIDQRLKSEDKMELFRDLTGVGMAVIIASHYRVRDFAQHRIPYLIWTGICLIAAPVAFWNTRYAENFPDKLVIGLDIILYGYILIHTFISVVLQKKYPRLNIKFGVIWLVMMVLMIVSRSTYIWPFCYLVMFGCFYLTDFSKEEQEDIFQGMLDGVILGFIVLQGFCFVFRPYDEVRYKGAYANSNLNALFYLVVLAALYTKILYMTRVKINRWIRLIYWLLAGAALSLELLTLGRTGWLTAAALSFAFCIFLNKLASHKRWWKNAAALVLCLVVMFPVTFGAVRYLPPVFHHPVWFWNEWSSSKVHSWDPWDSDKYVDIDEFWEAAAGRILELLKNAANHSPFAIKADAASLEKEPVLSEEQGTDPVLVRISIYRYYMQHLNLRGYPYEEQGFLLSRGYYVPHAHDVYLQYGTDFGIPVMILFIIMLIGGMIILAVKFCLNKTEKQAGYFLLLMITAVFGVLEYSWGAGSLNVLLMFIAWRGVICCEQEK